MSRSKRKHVRSAKRTAAKLEASIRHKAILRLIEQAARNSLRHLVGSTVSSVQVADDGTVTCEVQVPAALDYVHLQLAVGQSNGTEVRKAHEESSE